MTTEENQVESPEETHPEDADAVEAPPQQDEQAIEGGSVSVGGGVAPPAVEVDEDEDEDDDDEKKE